ncbi:MAG: gfo/Idh/MocA family oxidoreductase, partial [Opitutales bacterium]
VLTSTDPNRFDGTVTLFPNNGELKDVDMGFQYEGGRGLGLVDMVQAIRDSRTARASGEFAFHVLDVLLAFEESEKSGRRVEIGSSCEVPPPMPKTGI